VRSAPKSAVVLAALCTLVSCGREAPRAGQEQGRKAPSLPKVPVVVRFRPPADGLLTDAHIDHYIRVRRASRGRTDDEATTGVGVDPEEYAWSRARILEAIVQLETAQVRGAAEGTYSRTIAALRQAREGAKDRETARKLDEQIAALERERQGFKAPDPAPPAVVANARKIAPRRAEIQAPPK